MGLEPVPPLHARNPQRRHVTLLLSTPDHLSTRKSRVSLPPQVPELHIRAVVLPDRAYIFCAMDRRPALEEHVARLERARLAERIAHMDSASLNRQSLEQLAHEGHHSPGRSRASESTVASDTFGSQVIESLLGEVNAQLHTQTVLLVRAAEYELSTLDEIDDEIEVLKHRVRLGELRHELTRVSTCTEGVEEMLRVAIERDTADAASALGQGGGEGAEGKIEALLESLLHEVGSVTALLDRASVTASNMEQALEGREFTIRNALLRYEILTSAVGTGLAFGGVLSGIFGMNVSPGLRLFADPDPQGAHFFSVISAIAIGVLLVSGVFSYLLYRKAIRKALRRAWPGVHAGVQSESRTQGQFAVLSWIGALPQHHTGGRPDLRGRARDGRQQPTGATPALEAVHHCSDTP